MNELKRVNELIRVIQCEVGSRCSNEYEVLPCELRANDSPSSPSLAARVCCRLHGFAVHLRALLRLARGCTAGARPPPWRARCEHVSAFVRFSAVHIDMTQ